MIHSRFVKGNELETRLDQRHIQKFNSLMQTYFTEVSKENPSLIALDPPYGVKDIGEYLDSIIKGEKAQIPGECILGFLKVRGACEDLAGVLTFLENGDTLCETHLVVDKDYRGKGIGAELFKLFILKGKERGLAELRAYNFTVGGYATFRKIERELANLELVFENISVIKIRGRT